MLPIPTIRWQPSDPVLDHSLSITNGVRVLTRSFFVPERSAPHLGTFFFAYRIRIINESPDTVQLISRHWLITDGNGLTQEVSGEGVVGEQPTLDTGAAFEYTSVCPLGTRIGFMRGRYLMESNGTHRWYARIHEFALITPGIEN